MKDIMEMQKNVYDDRCMYLIFKSFYSLTFHVKKYSLWYLIKNSICLISNIHFENEEKFERIIWCISDSSYKVSRAISLKWKEFQLRDNKIAIPRESFYFWVLMNACMKFKRMNLIDVLLVTNSNVTMNHI